MTKYNSSPENSSLCVTTIQKPYMAGGLHSDVYTLANSHRGRIFRIGEHPQCRARLSRPVHTFQNMPALNYVVLRSKTLDIFSNVRLCASDMKYKGKLSPTIWHNETEFEELGEHFTVRLAWFQNFYIKELESISFLDKGLSPVKT